MYRDNCSQFVAQDSSAERDFSFLENNYFRQREPFLESFESFQFEPHVER
jgi:hypothetical protein